VLHPEVSSVLVEIESFRALARYAPEAVTRLHPALDQIDMIDLSARETCPPIHRHNHHSHVFGY
jgi:hypothetical protein